MGAITPPGQEGWPRQQESREASIRSGRGGCSSVCSSLDNHPVCADSGCFAIFYLLAQPPLLARRGDVAPSNSFTP
jgi:hypothetical protein